MESHSLPPNPSEISENTNTLKNSESEIYQFTQDFINNFEVEYTDTSSLNSSLTNPHFVYQGIAPFKGTMTIATEIEQSSKEIVERKEYDESVVKNSYTQAHANLRNEIGSRPLHEELTLFKQAYLSEQEHSLDLEILTFRKYLETKLKLTQDQIIERYLIHISKESQTRTFINYVKVALNEAQLLGIDSVQERDIQRILGFVVEIIRHTGDTTNNSNFVRSVTNSLFTNRPLIIGSAACLRWFQGNTGPEIASDMETKTFEESGQKKTYLGSSDDAYLDYQLEILEIGKRYSLVEPEYTILYSDDEIAFIHPITKRRNQSLGNARIYAQTVQEKIDKKGLNVKSTTVLAELGAHGELNAYGKIFDKALNNLRGVFNGTDTGIFSTFKQRFLKVEIANFIESYKRNPRFDESDLLKYPNIQSLEEGTRERVYRILSVYLAVIRTLGNKYPDILFFTERKGKLPDYAMIGFNYAKKDDPDLYQYNEGKALTIAPMPLLRYVFTSEGVEKA